MLRELAYLGHEVTSVDFKLLNKAPEGEGFYKYNLKLDENIQVSKIRDANTQLLSASVKAICAGYLSEEKPVFSLEVEFDLRFKIDREATINESELLESHWYIENLAHLEGNRVVENILSHTVLKGNHVPLDKREYSSKSE